MALMSLLQPSQQQQRQLRHLQRQHGLLRFLCSMLGPLCHQRRLPHVLLCCLCVSTPVLPPQRQRLCFGCFGSSSQARLDFLLLSLAYASCLLHGVMSDQAQQPQKGFLQACKICCRLAIPLHQWHCGIAVAGQRLRRPACLQRCTCVQNTALQSDAGHASRIAEDDQVRVLPPGHP